MANPIPNLFRVPELKEKILFTLLILLIYRFGAHITVPGVDVGILRQQFGALSGGILGIYDMFVGGGLSRATILALGIMPYISASIMFQLLAAVFPTVEKLQKEGEDGRAEADSVDPLHDRSPEYHSGLQLRRLPQQHWGRSGSRVHLQSDDDRDTHGRRDLRDVAR